ncbi:type II secretion system protein GspM [Pseudomonas protegens]|uniref:General secretion pathway protein GspM n=1 Tax=Pseudomonas protegens TaxID=380021 RepID=A0A9Q6IAN3_9PSED|nr:MULTISPECIES: type II secretion system protein GspM [Pseudomonas]MBW8355786.1 type II secretion system protein M [Pseudomonas sp.]MCY7264387.1 type II secretion system protein M [Pseudomonas protegens]MDP9513081.1 type II secretion system protein GspM [Pseudomonas protegens]PYC29013.1 general secretion pathway protein GspM [Pseudomonas protegens]WOE77047.1 type II secretion system protein GspM [Pseudomonas protegens]
MNKARLAQYQARWSRLRTQVHIQVQGHWNTLAPREKRLLSATALGVLGLLLWWLLIQPPLKTIDYWQAETPKLRAQAEALEVLLHEAAGPDSRGASLEQSLRQTLDGAGLKDHYQLQQPDEAGPESWRLTFEQAPADAVVGWLLGAPRQLSLQVVEARLQRAAAAAAQDSAGTLSGTVRMDQAQGAKEAS